MNATNLNKNFFINYISPESISGVIALSGMTNVDEISAASTSYTFEMNKNYKWVPSSSGAKTVDFAVYSGEVHGVAYAYIDLSNGGTLSFDSYTNVIGEIIANGINKVILEWWGTVKTAYLNCEIGTVQNTNAGSVEFLYTVYYADKGNVYPSRGVTSDKYNWPIYEGCGNYYDSGFTKNGKPIYTNGVYSLYFKTNGSTSVNYRWAFVKAVPSSDTFNTSNQYVDIQIIRNAETPVGEYRDGSVVIEYGSSLRPTINGLCGYFSYSDNNNINTNLDDNHLWTTKYEGSLSNASGIMCTDKSNYMIGQLPYGFKIVKDNYNTVRLSTYILNHSTMYTEDYIDGGVATSYISGWASNSYGESRNPGVLTAFIGYQVWRPGWPPPSTEIINDDPYIYEPDDPNPCGCCGDDPNPCGCGGGCDNPCGDYCDPCGGGDICGCDNPCGDYCDPCGGGNACGDYCGSGCDSGCGNACGDYCGSGCDSGCGCNACGGGNACGPDCQYYCGFAKSGTTRSTVTNIASTPDLVFDEIIIEVENATDEKFDENILGVYHEDGTYMNKHKVYTNDKGYYIGYNGFTWAIYKTYPGDKSTIHARGGNGYTDPSGTYASPLIEGLTFKATLNNTEAETK